MLCDYNLPHPLFVPLFFLKDTNVHMHCTYCKKLTLLCACSCKVRMNDSVNTKIFCTLGLYSALFYFLHQSLSSDGITYTA